MKDFVRRQLIRLFCAKGRHAWEGYTWGNAFVDHFDGTFGFCDVSMRSCTRCEQTEMYLKDGWQPEKETLGITDFN